MGPGDYAILPGTAANIDQSITIFKILNPEEHKEEFPDWEERLQNSYVLGWLTDEEDVEGYLGWASRVKLIQLTQEQYENVQQMLVDGKPERMPEWLDTLYHQYQKDLAAESPDNVPAPVTCSRCGKYTVTLHFSHSTELIFEVGKNLKDDTYAVLPSYHRSCTSKARLVCHSCHHGVDVPVEKLKADPNSNMAQILHHDH